MARVERRFVGVESATGRRNPAGFSPCQGVYHVGPERPHTAFIATHYNVDFSEHYLAPLMAERGFGFLGWNTRYRGNEPWFILEHALLDIAAGVHWLKQQGIERVVLLGNSGGGSLMAAYQSQASEPNIGAVADMRLPEGLHDLPAADLYVSLNAHGGRPEVLTDWMDPSVTDETDPLSVDESLNMYNPDNGPPYAPAFIRQYRDAQAVRNRRITAWVLAEIERLRLAGVYERVFTMQRVSPDDGRLAGSVGPGGRR